MGIKRVGHVVIRMRDLDKAKHFYGDVLGMQVVDERPNAVFFSFGESHHDVGVFTTSTSDPEMPNDNQVGLVHLALEVDSPMSLREVYLRCQEAGVEIERSTDHGFTLSFYLRDPDRNQIEVYWDVPGYDWRTRGLFEPRRSLDVSALG